MTELNSKTIDTIIRFALKEDIWIKDITSEATLNAYLKIDAVILSRGKGIVCGMEIMERVFSSVDIDLKFRPHVKDGDHIGPGQEIAFVEGKALSILKAERVALNFLSMLSGVSTRTGEIVNAVEGTGVKIYDTRKTIPLHRYFQKYAVTVGGGYNHRKGLWDMILIKDNHIRAFGMILKTRDVDQIIEGIIERAKSYVQKNVKIEIEVESIKECKCALDQKPDVIMLDNMSPDKIRKAVELRKEKNLQDKVVFEVSGGITLDNIKSYAETGVDIISTGSLTSGVQPVDFSLEIILK